MAKLTKRAADALEEARKATKRGTPGSNTEANVNAAEAICYELASLRRLIAKLGGGAAPGEETS